MIVSVGSYVVMEEKIKTYLSWKASYATRASVVYKNWLDKFVEVCGDKKLDEYDTNDTAKYKNWLEVRYSPYSVQLAFIVIKDFFNYYKLRDVPCLSPMFIKIPKIMQPKSHRAITEGEFKKIIAEIPQNDFRQLRDLVMIRLLWDTGMRVSELCDMDLSQISESKKSTTIVSKKSKRPRIIVWSDETHYFLMKYMGMRLKLKHVEKASALFVGWVKQQGWSSRATTRTIQRTIKYYTNRAGINEKITPHSFRHGWAHFRRDQNAPLAFIQKGLGHISPVTTFIYQQYNDNEFVGNAQKYLRAV